MTSTEIAKKQAEFVKNELLNKKMSGNCSGIIIADYTKEEYAKIPPGEDWDSYVEIQFLFIHYLRELGVSADVQFQHIDYDGLMKFCSEKVLKMMRLPGHGMLL